MSYIFPYLKYLKPVLGVFILGALCGVISGAASGFGMPYFMQEVYKDIFENKPDLSNMELLWVASMLPLVMILRGIFAYASQYLLNNCAMLIMVRIRLNVFAKLNELHLAYFDDKSTGDLMSRVTSDTGQMQSVILNFANEFIRQSATIAFAFSAIVYFTIEHDDILFLLLILAVAPIIAYPVRAIGKQLKYRGKQAQESMGGIMTHLHQNLSAMVEVRAFNLQGIETRAFERLLERYRMLHMKLVKYEKLSQPLMEFIAAAIIAICFAYAFKSDIPASVFFALAGILYFFLDSLKKLIRIVNDAQRKRASFQRIDDILLIENPIREPENPITLERFEGGIRFDAVSFNYGDTPTIESVDLHIPKGQTFAFVGPSGGGKSTLVKLLLRLYDPFSGKVSVGGEDIKKFETGYLREHIAMVSQKPILFDDTIENNIRIGCPGASDEAVREAAKAAHADAFIMSMPDGYRTVIGEDGGRLSGGQRQRIAIARAFLKNAPILILDEATSALDSESEAQIQSALEQLVKGKTVIVIAHRFSAIKLADQVVLIDEGRVLAQGAHRELYDSNDLYRVLCERQEMGA